MKLRFTWLSPLPPGTGNLSASKRPQYGSDGERDGTPMFPISFIMLPKCTLDPRIQNATSFMCGFGNPSILFNPFGGINVTTSQFGVHHRSSSRAQIPFMTRQASDWETDGRSSWYLCSGSTVGLSCLWVINCHGKITLQLTWRCFFRICPCPSISHKAMQRALFSQHISAGWPGWM